MKTLLLYQTMFVFLTINVMMTVKFIIIVASLSTIHTNIPVQFLTVPTAIQIHSLKLYQQLRHLQTISATYIENKVVFTKGTANQINYPTMKSTPLMTRRNRNKLQHSLNGNQRHMGIKAVSWNCNRGMVDHNGKSTVKLATIHDFLITNNIHLMAISESSLHGKCSKTIRANPLNYDMIRCERPKR